MHMVSTYSPQPKVYGDAVTERMASIKGETSKKANLYWAKCHCDVPHCTGVVTRFVGSKRSGWLRFCSKHKDIAVAIAYYQTKHPSAR